MYTSYLETLAKHCTQVFQDMAHTEVEDTKIKKDERLVSEYSMAQVIRYENLESQIAGHFILGFPSNTMATLVASAIAENMGMEPVKQVNKAAEMILQEFMNTIVGLTISDWDKQGMKVKFSPPTSLDKVAVENLQGPGTEAYLVIMSLGVVHVILRVTFTEISKQVKGPRVLLVDDSPLVTGVLSKNLQENGYQVEIGNNGREGVDKYKECKPDLVVMDLVMPELGGLEALEEIKAFDPDFKAVVLTSSAREDQLEKAHELGVKDYLMKPVKLPEMMKTLEKIIDLMP